ncbi:glycosyltransferase [Rhodoferax sp. 4810]|nr:glycosyltransferase [Rhodoferax jenense]
MKNNTPEVAVILAAYNGATYIAEQLKSILQQTDVDLQIFISVDKSTDETEDYLATLLLTEPRLTLLPFGQRFGGAGPNFYRLLREVDLSGFDYVCFADQDDLWHPEKLTRAHRLMTIDNADGYSSNFTAFWPSGKSEEVHKAWPQRSWDYLFESAGPGCTYVLHTRLALPLQQLVRGADNRLLQVDYHDWLTYAFARFHDFPWVIDDWSSMRYRQHAHNQIGVNSGLRSFWLRVKKILSGYGFEQSLLIADMIGASSLPLVQRGLRGGRFGYLWLALHARHCRRKPIDRVWFAISCVLLAFFKPAARTDS